MARGRTNKLRIIGGTHGGRVLGFPDVKGLRPTADRVRETLFNWLQADIPGARCLDLFAGSGALGLEALSRGADSMLFADRSITVVKQLKRNIELLQFESRSEVLCIDGLRLLRSVPDQLFDVVFLDPPFADDLLRKACLLLDSNDWLKPDALIYLEQDSSHPWPELPGQWSLYRETRAGQAACRLMRNNRLS